jgi:putative transposase
MGHASPGPAENGSTENSPARGVTLAIRAASRAALRRRQRAIARCKRGSRTEAKRRAALARFHARVADKRRDRLHKICRNLVNRFGRIAIEDLNVTGLSRGMLAKHVADASWAQLTAMLD